MSYDGLLRVFEYKIHYSQEWPEQIDWLNLFLMAEFFFSFI